MWICNLNIWLIIEYYNIQSNPSLFDHRPKREGPWGRRLYLTMSERKRCITAFPTLKDKMYYCFSYSEGQDVSLLFLHWRTRCITAFLTLKGKMYYCFSYLKDKMYYCFSYTEGQDVLLLFLHWRARCITDFLTQKDKMYYCFSYTEGQDVLLLFLHWRKRCITAFLTLKDKMYNCFSYSEGKDVFLFFLLCILSKTEPTMLTFLNCCPQILSILTYLKYISSEKS